MPDLQKLAQSAAMLGGAQYTSAPLNGAVFSTGRRYQFFGDDTRIYAAETGELATNCYDTAAQGIDPDDWYRYVPVRIRVAAAAQSITGATMLDDWKRIYIITPTNIDYIGTGAYMEFDNNVWIAYKPKNVSAVIANAVVRRCNAVINVLDYYGNIVAIPMSYARMDTQGNAPQITENMILSKNYISCICQYNQLTAKFTENSRMILGNTAYAMRGLDNFTREFTNDPDSVHLMTFTIERTEALDQDNLELQCADYYSFRWEIAIDVPRDLRIGNTQPLSIRSVRNGETVVSTVEYPITYIFETSDPDVAVVENGELKAVGIGATKITARLEQNPTIFTEISVNVSEGEDTYLAWSTAIPDTIKQYETINISAVYYEDGQPTDNEVTFTFSGAPQGAFSASVIDFNTVAITVYRGSTTPLTVTAESADKSLTATIQLTT